MLGAAVALAAQGQLAQAAELAEQARALGGDVRLAQCLQRVSAMANWNGGNDASGQGLACHRIGPLESGGRIAVIVTARRDINGVLVDKISAAVDIGRVVNLDIARQQIEGGLVYGLGLAEIFSFLVLYLRDVGLVLDKRFARGVEVRAVQMPVIPDHMGREARAHEFLGIGGLAPLLEQRLTAVAVRTAAAARTAEMFAEKIIAGTFELKPLAAN